MRIEITFTRTSLILLLLGIILALLFADRRNDSTDSPTADPIPNKPDNLDPFTTDAPYSNIGQTIAQNGSALLREQMDRRAREKAHAAGLNYLERA